MLITLDTRNNSLQHIKHRPRLNLLYLLGCNHLYRGRHALERPGYTRGGHHHLVERIAPHEAGGIYWVGLYY